MNFAFSLGRHTVYLHILLNLINSKYSLFAPKLFYDYTAK